MYKFNGPSCSWKRWAMVAGRSTMPTGKWLLSTYMKTLVKDFEFITEYLWAVIRTVTTAGVSNIFVSVKRCKHVFLMLSPVVSVLYYHYNGYRNVAHLITIWAVYSITTEQNLTLKVGNRKLEHSKTFLAIDLTAGL